MWPSQACAFQVGVTYGRDGGGRKTRAPGAPGRACGGKRAATVSRRRDRTLKMTRACSAACDDSNGVGAVVIGRRQVCEAIPKRRHQSTDEAAASGGRPSFIRLKASILCSVRQGAIKGPVAVTSTTTHCATAVALAFAPLPFA